MNETIHNGGHLSSRILRRFCEVQQIRSDWHELFHRCRSAAFQSPDWVLPWIEAFSPDKLVCVEVRCGDRLVGLAPLLIYRRDSDRVLAFAGGGVSDYLDVLVNPEFESQAISGVLEAVLNAQEDWSVLDLTDLPERSSLLNAGLLKSEAKEHDTCCALHLPETEDDLLHTFSKRQRANLRNARSRLERAGGGTVEIAENESVMDFLKDLFALHTGRWSGRGEPGVLNDELTRAFHLSSAPRLLDRGTLHLSRLRLKNRTLAVIYSLFSGETAFCYLQGFNPEFAQLSPGTWLMFSVMKNALSRGMRNFDFLRGRESYKQHWRAESKATYRIQLPRAAVSALLESSAQSIAA